MSSAAIPGLPIFSAAARRVRAEAGKPAVTKPEGLDYCLDCWKDWMTHTNDRDLGVKTMKGLAGDGDGHGVSPFDAQRERDYRIAEATDAMIESLTRLHTWAVYTSCSIATAWRFPNADLIAVYSEARSELEKKLRQNHCTAVLF